MDIKKAKILLDKTASLLRSVSTDEQNISAVERDLLKDYVRQLYAALLTEPASRPKSRIEMIRPKPAASVPPPRPTPPPPPAPKPRLIELPDSLKDLPKEPPVVTPPPPPAPKPPQPAPTPAPKPRAEKPAPKPAPKPEPAGDIPAELQEVFAVKRGTDLADRLASAPVNKLSKAMGLNEKLFTINELFGKDQDRFNQAMRDLDRLSTYDQAKLYLVDIARDQNWAREDRMTKAQNFMKLVYRRYL